MGRFRRSNCIQIIGVMSILIVVIFLATTKTSHTAEERYPRPQERIAYPKPAANAAPLPTLHPAAKPGKPVPTPPPPPHPRELADKVESSTKETDPDTTAWNGESDEEAIQVPKDMLSEEKLSVTRVRQQRAKASGRRSNVYPFERFPWCAELFEDPGKPLKKRARKWEPEGAEISEVIALSADCTQFTIKYHFPTAPLTTAEAGYPHAYVLMLSTDLERVIYFLQSIYWPQNFYCIHIDEKATAIFRRTVENIASCYSNIIMAPKSLDINKGDSSTLDAAMSCLRELNRIPLPWHYVQIYTSDVMPLQTNAEMVNIFKILNGSMDCTLETSNAGRFVFQWKDGQQVKVTKKESLVNIVPPASINVYNSQFQMTMPRAFINYSLHDPVAVELYNWMSKTMSPEEAFWPTLHYNLHLKPPSDFPGLCFNYYKSKRKSKPYISTFEAFEKKDWGQAIGSEMCRSGQFYGGRCVFGIEDLATLRDRPELTAYQIKPSFQPAAFACLHERLWNKTYHYQSIEEDYDFYKELPEVAWRNTANRSEFTCW